MRERIARLTGAGDDASAPDGSSATGSGTGRLARVFSPASFLPAFVTAVTAGVVLGAVLPWGRIGDLVGVFLAGGAVGLVVPGRHYLAVAAAGALTAGLAVLFGSLLVSIVGLGTPAAFGVGAGAVVAVLGHYVGRGVRAGLERGD